LLSLFLSNSSPSRAFSSPPQATSELKRKLADVKRKLEKVEVERKACGVSFTLMNNYLSIIRPFTAESTAVTQRKRDSERWYMAVTYDGVRNSISKTITCYCNLQ